jgi:hypothetical protein
MYGTSWVSGLHLTLSDGVCSTHRLVTTPCVSGLSVCLSVCIWKVNYQTWWRNSSCVSGQRMEGCLNLTSDFNTLCFWTSAARWSLPRQQIPKLRHGFIWPASRGSFPKGNGDFVFCAGFLPNLSPFRLLCNEHRGLLRWGQSVKLTNDMQWMLRVSNPLFHHTSSRNTLLKTE